MYSRLCVCDVCTEGRLLKGGEKRKTKQRKMKRRKKTFQGTRVRSFDVLGWQASASRFSSTLDLTKKCSPRRSGSPRPEKKVGGDSSLKANELMLAHKNANIKIWNTLVP